MYDAQYQKVYEKAKKQNVSMAKIIRDLIDRLK
jgi:hypothetical protein